MDPLDKIDLILTSEIEKQKKEYESWSKEKAMNGLELKALIQLIHPSMSLKPIVWVPIIMTK
jgi:hypothetical protein